MTQTQPPAPPQLRDLSIPSIGGHAVTADTERQYTSTTGPKTMLRLSLEDAPGMGITVDPGEVLRNNIGTMVQLGNRVEGIPAAIAEHERRIAEAHTIVEQADARLGVPFAHADELAAAHERVQRIAEELNTQSASPAPEPAEPTPQTAFGAAFPRALREDLQRAHAGTPERYRDPSQVTNGNDLER